MRMIKRGRIVGRRTYWAFCPRCDAELEYEDRDVRVGVAGAYDPESSHADPLKYVRCPSCSHAIDGGFLARYGWLSLPALAVMLILWWLT